MSSELTHTEETLTANNPADNTKALQNTIKHLKSDLEIAENTAQQQQATEAQAEQQLRDEQEKLTGIESQLDELIRTTGSTAETSGRNRP